MVRKWPVPKSLKELRSYVEFCTCYRRFVRSFTQMARPLHQLIAELSKLYQGKRRSTTVSLGGHWTPACQVAFESLRDALVTAPVPAYPRYDEPSILKTDSSDRGLGAVLTQVQDGKTRVIGYACRGLRKGESNKANYSSRKLELLALKWGVTDKFRYWLIGS